MAGIPYVGCGVAASAVAMDKALAKKIFEAHQIPQAPYCTVPQHEWKEGSQKIITKVEARLHYPVFVKPANMGSSVGINKAKDRKSLISAIAEAFQFDTKIVVEKSMENCREVECAILGNNQPKASVIGEIIPGADFYNYETKYLDDKSKLVIPAELDDDIADEVRNLSIAAFRAIDGAGLARVDFFVDKTTHDIFLNEVNTLPGFTPISMYPQLWAASGMDYPKLIDQLIELALEKHAQRSELKRTF